MIKLSDYIVKFLAEKGVKQVNMIVGGGAMHLNDSVGRSDLSYTCFCHEQALAIATEAHGQFTNFPGIGFVTSGPGGTNALTAVSAAYIDSTPCIFISGQAKRSDLMKDSGVRQMGSQEVDIVSMITPTTKYAVTVMEPESIKFHLEKAWYEATNGRKGPVWIDIPLDVQGSMVNESDLINYHVDFPLVLKKWQPSEKKMDRLLSLFNGAKRPLVLAGNGIKLAGAIDKFTSFIETYNIPTLLTWKAIDFLDYEHPLNFGSPGIMGCRTANFMVQNADLLIVIGSRLDSSLTAFNSKAFGERAKKVMIDIDIHEINKIEGLTLGIECDCLSFFQALKNKEDRLFINENSKWIAYGHDLKRKYPTVSHRYSLHMTDEKVDTYDLVDKIFNKLTSEDIITPESSGAAGEVTYQAMRIKKGQLVKNAAGLGSMGFGLPYSIGACLATKRRTILINGDGAFQLNIQELETLSRLQLPIKIFILNNGGYGSIENTQDNMFQGFYVGANAKSGFTLPDIGKIATAYGLRVEYIDCVNEVESGIDCTLDGKNPVVCIVKTGKTIISPKVQAIKLPDGNMQSKPLHDMWPYLSKEELESNMFRE